MLANAPVMTMLPVVDMARARSFYEGKLGLTSKASNAQGNVLYDCKGSVIALFQRADSPKAEHTALSWEVDDIGAVVKGLRAKGVTSSASMKISDPPDAANSRR